MVYSMNDIKNEVRDLLREYLYPSCRDVSTELVLSDGTTNIQVAQSFRPFCKFASTIVPYKVTIPVGVYVGKYGTPDSDLIVSIQSSTDGEPSGNTIGSYTIDVSDIPSGSIDLVDCSIKTSSMLGSNTEYFVVVESSCTPSTIDYYVVGTSTDDVYMIGSLSYYKNGTWNTSDVDMGFYVTPINWIHSDYPRDDIGRYSFPRIAVDVTSRRATQRLITASIIDYYIDLIVVGYSLIPQELDDILSYVDRILFKNRTLLEGIYLLTPGDLSSTEVIRDYLFSRSIRYTLWYRMTST